MESAASCSTQSLLACRRQWSLPRSPGQLSPSWTPASRLGGQQVAASMAWQLLCSWEAQGLAASVCCPLLSTYGRGMLFGGRAWSARLLNHSCQSGLSQLSVHWPPSAMRAIPLPCWPGGPPQWNGPAFQRPCSGSVIGWLPCLLFKISVMRRCSRGHGVPQLHFGTLLCYLQQTGLPWPQISRTLQGLASQLWRSWASQLQLSPQQSAAQNSCMRWLSICPAAGLPSQTTAAPALGCTLVWSACVFRGWWRQWLEIMPPATAFAALALPRLGWRFPGGPVQIQALSVRAATWAQLGRVGEQRQHRHARFVSHVFVASNCPAPSSERDQAAVLKHLLSQLWKLPWHNQHKEVYWRLTLDALPTAARLHHVDPCICGEPIPNWFHHFWSCPVAAGLLAVLSTHLESRGMLPTLLLPLHVLLAQPPSSRLHVGIWRVVCLAAICALDRVRRTACAIALAGVPSQAASAPA